MILISPYSRKVSDDMKNPKNYPWWKQVVSELKDDVDDEIIQIGVKGEPDIGVHKLLVNLPLLSLARLVNDCKVWASVDNFLPHFCNYHYPEKRGVVIYGPSDPDIFGYPHNVNFLRDRCHLRIWQFEKWTQCDYKEERFVEPAIVTESILNLMEKTCT